MAEDNLKSSTPDLAGILGEILANKEIMEKVGEIAGSSEAKTASNESPKIDSLLSDPDIISKLPEVMSVIKPLLSGESQSKNDTKIIDKRMGLLVAMKPYLSPKRCEAIDYIARMSKLSDTLKGLL